MNQLIRPLACLVLALAVPALAGAEGRYIITFKNAAQGRSALYAAGGRPVLELGAQNAVAAMLPEAAAAALANNPAIEFIEQDAPRKMLSQVTPFGIDMVQAPQVWLTWPSVTGANRLVCIIDSGLNTPHADMQGLSVVGGYPTGWNDDTCGHGTHVAGTIAAQNNTQGVVGVVPGVNLYIVKVFGGADCAWTYASTLVDALNRCQTAGANVVSMSLGGGRASRTEETAFKNANTAGVLSIAAAGNDGTTGLSYPASYASVVSVAAIDSSKVVADFSQKNAQVDVAAPGVHVLSTVPWLQTASLTAAGTVYEANLVEGAPTTPGVTGAMVNGGLCDSVGAWAGKVVLCQRGVINFSAKVNNVGAGGGTAAVIYNNVDGSLSASMAGVATTTPAVGISKADGEALVASSLGVSATVEATFTAGASGYEAWDGTSMATPHVSAVAALVWSYNPAWTNAQVRNALEKSAEDLGTAGRDDSYGNGLVRAKAALDYLLAPTNILLTVTGTSNKSGSKTAKLTWTGSSALVVDVFRNGVKVASPSNTGTYSDALGRVAVATYTYRVCESATSVCSPNVSITF